LPKNYYVPGTAFLLDRESWQKLAHDGRAFDESLHTYWEDVDLSMRAHAEKVKVAPWPAVQLLHKVGKTCHRNPFYTRFLFQRNRRIVSRRYVAAWMRPLQARILGPAPREVSSCST
jgi:GT2 family glycosyltransferase